MDFAVQWAHVDTRALGVTQITTNPLRPAGDSGDLPIDSLALDEIASTTSPCHPVFAVAEIPLSPGSSFTPSTANSTPSSCVGERIYGPIPSVVFHDNACFGGAGSGKGAQFTIIANVPYDTVRQDLVMEFRKFGRVELAMVVCDEASRHPHKEWTSTLGYAFVRFSKRSEAAAAIQAAALGLISIRGTRVRADWARKDSYAKRSRVPGNTITAQQSESVSPEGNSGNTGSDRVEIMVCDMPCNSKSIPAMEALNELVHTHLSTKPQEGGTEVVRNVSLDLAAGLSPISRSVLAGALSDLRVRELATDLSPPALRQKAHTPEELLHFAVCSAPVFLWDGEACAPIATARANELIMRLAESDFTAVSDGEEMVNSDSSYSTAATGIVGQEGNKIRDHHACLFSLPD